jgi:hypothetical protein
LLIAFASVQHSPSEATEHPANLDDLTGQGLPHVYRKKGVVVSELELVLGFRGGFDTDVEEPRELLS